MNTAANATTTTRPAPVGASASAGIHTTATPNSAVTAAQRALTRPWLISSTFSNPGRGLVRILHPKPAITAKNSIATHMSGLGLPPLIMNTSRKNAVPPTMHAPDSTCPHHPASTTRRLAAASRTASATDSPTAFPHSGQPPSARRPIRSYPQPLHPT